MSNNGFKDNKGKVSYQEVEPSFIEGIAKVMNFTKIENGGKYKKFNYKEFNDIEEYNDAIQRHLIQIRKGDYLDNETKLSHYFHIAANAMMANYHLQEGRAFKEFLLNKFVKDLKEYSAITESEKGLDKDGNKDHFFDTSKLKTFDGHVYLSGKEAFYKILKEGKSVEDSNGMKYNKNMSFEVLKKLHDSESDNYFTV